MTTAPPETATPAKTKTPYHVLKKTGEATYELVAPNIRAANQAAAIRAHVESSKTGGEFVAVPSRSFTHLTARVETTTAVKLA